MDEIQVDNPLRLIQRHELMPLYKVRPNGVETNKNTLFWELTKYLNARYSYRTYIYYNSIIHRLLKSVNVEKPHISIKHINNFLVGKPHATRAAIKAFLDFVDEEYNCKFVEFKFTPLKKREKKIVFALSEEDVYKIIDKIEGQFKFFCEFLYMTGCRISEPINIKVLDVNWKLENVNKELEDVDREDVQKDKTNNAYLTISKTKSKKQRIVPINPEFTKKLYDYLAENDKLVQHGASREEQDYIFDFYVSYGGTTPKKVYRQEYIEKKLKLAKEKDVGYTLEFKDDKELFNFRLESARLKYVRTISRAFQIAFKDATSKLFNVAYTPHILRKSRATTMLKKGMSLLAIRDYLGHSSLITTEAYLFSSLEEMSEKMKELKL